jgi:hypothetical protein
VSLNFILLGRMQTCTGGKLARFAGQYRFAYLFGKLVVCFSESIHIGMVANMYVSFCSVLASELAGLFSPICSALSPNFL